MKASVRCLTASFATAAIAIGVVAPAPAQSDSRWNVLAYGGKGEMRAVPVCQALSFFSKSTLPLDFDSDFFQAKPQDLTTEAKIIPLGAIGGRKIFEVLQTVHRRGFADSHSGPAIKILLVERGPKEFCDIYQNQYDYDNTNEIDQAAVLNLNGTKILKTYETDRRTWFLVYWAMDEHGPVALDTGAISNAVDSASPPGAMPFRAALDFSGPHFTAEIYQAGSNGTQLGNVDLELSVEGNQIVVRRKRWIPNARP